mmetsp:Transcript_12099/g.44987  ORF Transcript_12099/g.44987 Transcript_12099/m.44987 type:complete len:244 (+) Transcript_12099:1811-2542(+)
MFDDVSLAWSFALLVSSLSPTWCPTWSQCYSCTSVASLPSSCFKCSSAFFHRTSAFFSTIGDATVATSSAQIQATYGFSEISPDSRADCAITNPSSPRPTMHHPTTHPLALIVEFHEYPSSLTNSPTASFPKTAGKTYPIPSPNPVTSNISVKGIRNPTLRKNTEYSQDAVGSCVVHAVRVPSTLENIKPPTKAPSKCVLPNSPAPYVNASVVANSAPNTRKFRDGSVKTFGSIPWLMRKGTN